MIPAWILALPTLAAVIGLVAYLGERDCARTLRRMYIDAQDALTDIHEARSAATAKANHTRAAKRRALRDATTQQLKENGPRQA